MWVECVFVGVFCVYVYWRFWTECLVQCGVLLYSCEMPAYPVMIRECRVITGAASASSQGHLWLPSLTKAKLPGLPSTLLGLPTSPLSLCCLSFSAVLSSFSPLISLTFLIPLSLSLFLPPSSDLPTWSVLFLILPHFLFFRPLYCRGFQCLKLWASP